MSGSGASTGLKLILAAVIVIALLGAAFWAGNKALKKDTTTTSPTMTQTPFTTAYDASPIVNPSAKVGNRVGDIAPDFRLPNAKGGSVSLSDYRGFRPVVLNIWKSDCKVCVDLLPVMERVQSRYGEQYFTLFVNRMESQGVVASYADRSNVAGVRYILDPADTMIHLMGASEIPHTIFIKADGTIASIKTGAISEQDIEAGVKSILP